MQSLLEVKNIKKVYTSRFGGHQVQALSNITFSIEEGEYVAVMGESGSGKTTLLNIVASLDQPTSGQIQLGGKDLSKIKERDLSAFRREHLGFVFQDFNLLDTFSVRDNVYLPLVLSGEQPKEMDSRIEPIANKLGITPLLDKFPYEISGGEKQRTAVARALITHPNLILADEPTGALDTKATDQLLDMFSLLHEEGQTIMMVTHSIRAAAHASRVLFIKDGIVYHQIYRGERSKEEMYRMISDTLTVMVTGGQ